MKWEYFRLATVESRLDEALQDLGEEGWELVTVLPEERLFHGYQCVLKRPYTGAQPPRRNQTTVTPLFNKYLTAP
jgi:hypothetical protein